MKTETHFFATRTLARAFLNESTAESAKFKDFGTTAAKGERWAVLVDVPDLAEPAIAEAFNETQVQHTRWRLLQDADTIANQRPGIIGEETLKTPNNKPVVVSWRRSMVAVRLRNHMANAS